MRFSFRSLVLFLILITMTYSVGVVVYPVTWKLSYTIPVKRGVPLRSRVSPDGTRILIADLDGGIQLLDAANGREIYSQKAHSGPIYGLQFSHDGRRYVSTGGDLWANVWDTVTGKKLLSLREHSRPVTRAFYQIGDEQIVTVSDDARLRVWDASSGREMSKPAMTLLDCRAVLSVDQSRFARLDPGGGIIVHSSRTGRMRPVLLPPGEVLSTPAFSPDGTRIAASGRIRAAYIWDLDSGELLQELGEPGSTGWRPQFSRDGVRIATLDGATVLIWDMRTGHRLAELTTQFTEVQSATFFPRGTRLLIRGREGTISVWRRVRPERWWGVFYLPVTWLTCGLALLLIWSIRNDRRSMRAMIS